MKTSDPFKIVQQIRSWKSITLIVKDLGYFESARVSVLAERMLVTYDSTQIFSKN